MRIAAALFAVLIAATSAGAEEGKSDGKADGKAKATKFWNLTGETITKLELAPTGTTDFGPDQAKNDKDGAVDNDERLKVVGVADGTYDARLTDKNGRVCMATGLEIKDGAVFSVEKDQLKDCK